MSDRMRNWLLVGTVVVCCSLLCLFTWGAKQDASNSASATERLSAIIDRRSPTLEYMACKDVANDAFNIAQGELVSALVNRQADLLPELNANYVKAIEGLKMSQKAKEEGGCGELPTLSNSSSS